MQTHFILQRLLCGTIAATLLIGFSPVNSASAQLLSNNQGTAATFELRPHCESTQYTVMFGQSLTGAQLKDDSQCPQYDVADPQTKKTATLNPGDPLDMDLLIQNPSGQPVERFRAWIAYDPKVLEGEKVEISKLFPTPNPGESDFSASDGYIKVSGTALAPQTTSTILVARIRLHVLQSTLASSPVSFYDASGTIDSHTGIFVKNGNDESNICAANLGALSVQLTGTDQPPAGAQTSSRPSPSASGSGLVTAPVPETDFSQLQVQNLRLTTQGSSVFLAWDALPSSRLAGYNLYYGTVSGKYIQKRSVAKGTTDITIRALPNGVTYYFSVRGVNAQNQETDFSQEQGISVGDPTTSTAPLTSGTKSVAPRNPVTKGTISGDTGTPSALLLLLGVCAVVGTMLAFRRQFSAKIKI